MLQDKVKTDNLKSYTKALLTYAWNGKHPHVRSVVMDFEAEEM